PMGHVETDEDLNRLERDIRQLKIEYEQYFGGGKKRPPNDVEWRIDQVIKRHGDRGAQMSYSQRFRYSNLTQTYAKYRDVFHKRMQKREEGGVEHHFGAAARAIEAERARKQAAEAVPPPQARVSTTRAEANRESQKLDQLYATFREALERSGQATEKLSRESLEQFVKQKTEQLRKQKGSEQIEFIVSVDGGKARLKALFKS